MDKLQINRDNYEEYLLLYVDDELSATEQEQVTAFLLKNPDLAEELDMLRETKCSDDQMPVFKHKELLYKTSVTDIHTENCEEWFLLYTDNELTAKEKEAVDNWVERHPAYKQHLEILLATRLPQEQIVFANKEALYRKDAAQVVSFSPMRWTAAAAILLLLTGAWLFWNNDKSPGREVAEVNTDKSQQPLQSKDIAADTNNKVAKELTAKIEKVSQQSSKDKTLAKNDGSNKSAGSNGQVINVKETKTDDAIVTSNQDEPYEIAIINDDMAGTQNNTNVAGNDLTDAEMNEAINAIVNAALSEKVQSITDKDMAMLTYKSETPHYTVLQTDDDKNSFYVGSLNLNKNKVKGLLRKAGKLFNDKTKNIADANGDIIKTTSGAIKK